MAFKVGVGCAKLHDAMMRDLQVSRIELDEIWQYVQKKRNKIKETDPDTIGNQYTFIALDGTSKAILSLRTGKRDAADTQLFLADLHSRVIGSPEISSDAFRAYPGAVEQEFGWQIDYGIIDKNYRVTAANEAARRYSLGHVVSVTRKVVLGDPQFISTSYVERQNLTLRMQQRRFTRLTNAFSKKLENHIAATALYAAWYNLCRAHEAHRVTPAMQLGVYRSYLDRA